MITTSSLSHTLPRITYSLLQKQNAETSQAIIQYYTNSPSFQSLATIEEHAILTRDMEDGEKLQRGITYAQEKGVLEIKKQLEPYVEIDVAGKSPKDVSEVIMSHVYMRANDKKCRSHDKREICTVVSEGNIILLCGLSGTGKGTTVLELQHTLKAKNIPVVTWSNGNLFRTLTLLALTWWEDMYGKDSPFDLQQTLTKENIAFFMSMLHHRKISNKYSLEDTNTDYDIQIDGLHYHKIMVSDIQNTQLKSSQISHHLPSVAEYIQGEVIIFAAQAMEKMKLDGMTILVEGREQTLNFVPTPLRFTLVLSDRTLIGKRRAAQRIMARSLETMYLGNTYNKPDVNDVDVTHVTSQELFNLLHEVGM